MEKYQMTELIEKYEEEIIDFAYEDISQDEDVEVKGSDVEEYIQDRMYEYATLYAEKNNIEILPKTKEDIKKIIANKLKQFRKECGITSPFLASELVGFARNTVYLIEKGKRVPNRKTIYILSFLYGVNESDRDTLYRLRKQIINKGGAWN